MTSLEERCSLALLVSTNLKMLAPLQIGSARVEQTHLEILLSRESSAQREMREDLDGVLGVVLAALALQLQHNLLGGLGLKLGQHIMLLQMHMTIAIVRNIAL